MQPVQLISPRILQLILGVGSLFLPLALLVGVWLPLRRDDTLQPTMSEFIYTASAPVFIGALFSICVLFLSYRGYPGRAEGSPFTDRQLALVAATGALMTGVFPSDTCFINSGKFAIGNPWDLPGTGALHFFGAVMLFFAGGWLSFFHFPLSDKINPNSMKRLRSKIHRFCGAGIAVFTVMLILIHIFGTVGNCAKLNRLSPVFFIEAGMTILFAFAWIVKSQFIFGDAPLERGQ